MVRISPEEVMARRQTKQQLDDLPAWKRQALGSSARIDIPLDNVQSVLQVAGVLKDLAEFLEKTSARSDLDPYTALISVKYEIIAANKHIRAEHGGANKNGTFPKKASRE